MYDLHEGCLYSISRQLHFLLLILNDATEQFSFYVLLTYLFTGNFSGKDANIIRDGSDQIAMEVFSFRTKQAYNKRVEKVQHIDESLHLGHYHKFYIDDEKREYVQKVLLTSGLACVIKEAFHSILDGWIWDYVGMPLMNFVKTALTWRRRKVSLQ